MSETTKQPPEYSPEGVDLTLIRWFRTLTPAQRLAALEEHLDDLEQMRELNRKLIVKPNDTI